MATVSIAPARPRRFLELGLMGLALAVGISGYVLTSLNYTGTIPATFSRRWACSSRSPSSARSACTSSRPTRTR